MQEKETKEMLADLIWLNAVIATELIQITENSSAILRKSPPPGKLPCRTQRAPEDGPCHGRQIPAGYHARPAHP